MAAVVDELTPAPAPAPAPAVDEVAAVPAPAEGEGGTGAVAEFMATAKVGRRGGEIVCLE